MRRYEVLEQLVKLHGWSKGAELGIHRGTTFFYLLDNCPSLSLIGVDLWEPLPADQVKDINRGLSSAAARLPALMQKYSSSVMSRAADYSRATVYRMDTVEASRMVNDASLDFIFVDAEHTTDAVLADVSAWAPKVREGGWILGHDEQWPSVRRALASLFDRWTVHADNVWSVP